MRTTEETKTYTAMDNDRIGKIILAGIQSPGTQKSCRNPVRKPPRQLQEQKVEQNVMPGYFRSRIPEQDPVNGEAG